MNSCIMLSTTLYTGVDLWAAFKDEDLVAPGIERDSHITLLYSEDRELPMTDLAGILKNILGDYEWEKLLADLKSQTPMKVLDHFGVSTFSGEGQDYLVLRLQPESPLYDTLQILHSGLKAFYDVTPKFPDYHPHMTLATMEPGRASSYVFNPTLGLILEKATFTLDDFVISYGETGDWKQYQVTTENAVSRYFRQLRAEKDAEYYKNL